jgi:hypothetical protein
LVQEGIQEALGKKVIKLRVVDKLKNDRYNAATFEDGILYLEVGRSAPVTTFRGLTSWTRQPPSIGMLTLATSGIHFSIFFKCLDWM